MLSSHAHLLSKGSISSPSSRSLPATIARSGSLPRRPRPYQQVRAFRLGLWSSYLDVNFQKEFRRRQRIMKHKYIEALNRKMSWDRHFPMHLRHFRNSGLKSFMCSAWRGQDSRPGGRWVNTDDLEYMKQRNEQAEKDRGIDDVEQNALNDLLDNHHTFILSKSRMFGPGWSTCHSASSTSRPVQDPNSAEMNNVSASSTLYESEGFRKRFHSREYDQYEDQTEYIIDPITNRKVPKKPEQPSRESSIPEDIPVKTFKGYRLQFKPFEPPKDESNGVSSQSDSRPAEQVQSALHNQDTSSLTGSMEVDVDPLAKYEQKERFDSCRQYDNSEMDIDYSDPVQQGLKSYDDKLSRETSTKASVKETPRDDTGHDGLKVYDEKVKNQVRQFFASPYGEVDQVTDPVQQAMDRYYAFRGTRSSRVTYPDKTASEDSVLKAKREYEQSDSRRAFLREQQSERLLGSIQKYEQIMSEERAKGHVIGSSGHEQLHPLLKAISEYEAWAADKKIDPRDGAADDRTDPLLRAIREYKRTVSLADTEISSNTEHIEKVAIDPLLNAINDYEAYVEERGGRGIGEITNDPNECLKTYDAKVNFYRKPYQIEDDTDYHSALRRAFVGSKSRSGLAGWLSKQMEADESPVANQEASNTPKSWAHLPQKIRDLFAKEAKVDTEASEVNDLLSRVNSVHASPAASESREIDQKKAARRKALEEYFESTQLAEADAQLSAERLRERTLALKSDIMESRQEGSLNGGQKEFREVDKSTKLTGDSVRDFLEEFQTTWTTSEESSGGLTRKHISDQQVEADVQNGERAYINGLSDREAFSGKPDVERLETSLDRTVSRKEELKNVEDKISQTAINHGLQGEEDLSASVSTYSTPKQNGPKVLRAYTANIQSQAKKNLEKQQYRDLVREVRSIYEDAYGPINSKHRQTTSSIEETVSRGQEVVTEQAVERPEPSMYKILAYDPTMQSIRSAETTSVVPDSSGPLTPAEVLLRLSNPAKFFPHLEPLRSQGYEIVSGSGDVLVFRKTREASPSVLKESAAIAAKDDETALEHKKNIMNPIDGMMRGPIAATGDFASPTGFVNHDIPRGSEPLFKSNIDVRREEPVFSGKRNWEDKSGKKKRGAATTVLIGAGWLAACSYAIGVVSEYFKTGGVDGQGPKGF